MHIQSSTESPRTILCSQREATCDDSGVLQLPQGRCTGWQNRTAREPASRCSAAGGPQRGVVPPQASQVRAGRQRERAGSLGELFDPRTALERCLERQGRLGSLWLVAARVHCRRPAARPFRLRPDHGPARDFAAASFLGGCSAARAACCMAARLGSHVAVFRGGRCARGARLGVSGALGWCVRTVQLQLGSRSRASTAYLTCLQGWNHCEPEATSSQQLSQRYGTSGLSGCTPTA